MNGQILTKLENLEKELREIKTLVKSQTKDRPNLTLSQIARKLKPAGKRITSKEIASEIAAYRNNK